MKFNWDVLLVHYNAVLVSGLVRAGLWALTVINVTAWRASESVIWLENSISSSTLASSFSWWLLHSTSLLVITFCACSLWGASPLPTTTPSSCRWLWLCTVWCIQIVQFNADADVAVADGWRASVCHTLWQCSVGHRRLEGERMHVHAFVNKMMPLKYAWMSQAALIAARNATKFNDKYDDTVRGRLRLFGMYFWKLCLTWEMSMYYSPLCLTAKVLSFVDT